MRTYVTPKQPTVCVCPLLYVEHMSCKSHVHIVTVCALQDIQNAASEENMDIVVPPHLNRIDRVSEVL
jgi:hypothetical protein